MDIGYFLYAKQWDTTCERQTSDSNAQQHNMPYHIIDNNLLDLLANLLVHVNIYRLFTNLVTPLICCLATPYVQYAAVCSSMQQYAAVCSSMRSVILLYCRHSMYQ